MSQKVAYVTGGMGGIGTGNVSVGARGELKDWEIFNWPGKGQFIPFSFFAIWAKPENQPSVTRILEGDLVPPYYKSHGFLNGELAGLPRFKHSTMEGKQPFVYVDLEDPTVPVNVRMEAFTPFIPLNADDSGIPTAIIRFRVRNPLSTPASVSVMGSLANVVGFRGYDVFNNVKLSGEVVNTYRTGDGFQGLYYTAKNLDRNDFRFGSMSLVTTNTNVNSRTQWLQGQWTDNAQDFWDDFSDDGLLGTPKDRYFSNSRMSGFIPATCSDSSRRAAMSPMICEYSASSTESQRWSSSTVAPRISKMLPKE